MRVVIDTNILISAVFWTGKPKEILNGARKRSITFLTSEPLLKEMKDVLISKNRPFQISKKDANFIVEHLKKVGEVITTKSTLSICKDEPDNRVLECAIDGNADYIVTGDKQLLKVKEIRGVKIITSAKLLRYMNI